MMQYPKLLIISNKKHFYEYLFRDRGNMVFVQPAFQRKLLRRTSDIDLFGADSQPGDTKHVYIVCFIK